MALEAPFVSRLGRPCPKLTRRKVTDHLRAVLPEDQTTPISEPPAMMPEATGNVYSSAFFGDILA